MYSVWGVLLIVFLYLFFKTTNVRSKKYFLMISVLLTSLANIFNWLIGGYYTDMTTYSLAFSFAVSSAIATYIGAQFLLKGQHMNIPFELPPVGSGRTGSIQYIS
jgi:glucan phosphoethanolaminetransferase (alkaline phosphatase superfamily)